VLQQRVRALQEPVRALQLQRLQARWAARSAACWVAGFAMPPVAAG
jgi:hypothetical protein